MSVTAQLPGVRFLTEPRHPAEALPRMDIAGFVGFARKGPLHTPVAVESVARFREIFGDDLQLAWDAEHGGMEYSHLGPAVESFFRNGGLRCWVVRVAGDNASTFQFPLLGVIDAEAARGAMLQARSPGRWASQLRVGTVLVRENLPLNFSAETASPSVTPFSARTSDYYVDIVARAGQLQKGDLLEVIFGLKKLILFLFVENIRNDRFGLRLEGKDALWFLPEPDSPPPFASPPSSPPDDDNVAAPVRLVRLTENDGLDRYENLLSGGSPGATPVVRRLSFNLLVWRGDRIESQISNLAFSGNHPRFWGNLPSDEDFFTLSQGRMWKETGVLAKEASDPRFPLAAPPREGLLGGILDTNQVLTYLPVGMSVVADSNLAAPPSEDPDTPRTTALEDEGLATFCSRLFLDRDLGTKPLAELLGEAEHKYYVRGKPLSGIHSLLPVSEVTMLAVPDAVHRGWTREVAPPEEPGPLDAPFLGPIQRPDAEGHYRLDWSPDVPGATGYILQQDRSPNFDEPVTIYEGPERDTLSALPGPCPEARYFRVRAARHGEVSPWSNNRGTYLPGSSFLNCGDFPPEALGLRLGFATDESPPDGTTLVWEPYVDENVTPAPASEFEVQDALDSDFESAQTFPAGPDTRFTIPERLDATHYYRVRVIQANREGPWSNTITLLPGRRSEWILKPVSEYHGSNSSLAGGMGTGAGENPVDTLLAVQGALMRFCAARGDILSILALPRHYRREDVLDHLISLTTPDRSTFRDTIEKRERDLANPPSHEQFSLSYGALYHPWVAAPGVGEGSNQTSSIRFVPPEGTVGGMMARRTIRFGAWFAPANQPLSGVVALDPEQDLADWVALFTAQMNLIRREPRGYLVLSADTLSPRTDLRPINVRRLLILLRRIAFRHGATHVFEPNSADFRDSVRNNFENLLSDLYERGAFAGDNPRAAFRVVADETVNTPQSLDRGRFIVELQVAPSRPLAFLNVRLVQTGPEQFEIRES